MPGNGETAERGETAGIEYREAVQNGSVHRALQAREQVLPNDTELSTGRARCGWKSRLRNRNEEVGSSLRQCRRSRPTRHLPQQRKIEGSGTSIGVRCRATMKGDTRNDKRGTGF